MSVVISPATTTRPVVISVSQATRPSGSCARTASRTESEIWSAILSGWPSVTDSDENRNVRAAMSPGTLADADEPAEDHGVPVRRAGCNDRAQRLEVRADLVVRLGAREAEHEWHRRLQVGVDQPRHLVRHVGGRELARV